MKNFTYFSWFLGQFPPGQFLPRQLPPGQLSPGNSNLGQLTPGQLPPRTTTPRQFPPRIVALWTIPPDNSHLGLLYCSWIISSQQLLLRAMTIKNYNFLL